MADRTPERFHSKFLIKAATVAGALLVIILVFDNFIMPWYVNRWGIEQVPSVVGLKQQEAFTRLEEAGLSPREGGTRLDPKFAAGVVVQQSPEANQIVKRGRRVYLIVSGGEQKAAVPGVRGKTIRDARFALERDGFVLGAIEYILSDEFPENTVIDQSISAGSAVRRGAAVAVTVSSGRSGALVAVPAVVGKSVSDAERLLAQEGFRPGKVTYQVSNRYLPNTVLDQYPRPGTSAAAGSAVDLFVAQAPSSKIPSVEN